MLIEMWGDCGSGGRASHLVIGRFLVGSLVPIKFKNGFRLFEQQVVAIILVYLPSSGPCNIRYWVVSALATAMQPIGTITGICFI